MFAHVSSRLFPRTDDNDYDDDDDDDDDDEQTLSRPPAGRCLW